MAKKKQMNIHPNALTVGIIGAIIAIWLAGRHQTVIAGEVFFAVAIMAALAVNRIQR
ncbi:hypothetical protein G7Y31_11450 [Corynebacterium lizhenjunii]|uniref:Uncharacterized protein n=1 Tax=Corynebacterium lizhenjunii TaxID=2709394 RepID=A0A7T0KEF4_9CORY|nr:hypothetical protein [Corynebacterium lizhenjunii]QPK79087.1 hypothetical protein G7Y31_11450 [Corynebacterium lizhenjunii]